MKRILLSLFSLIALMVNAQTGNLLSNSSFEEWSDNLPTHWATLSKVSNATIEQSSDAHSGNSAVVVKGASSSNKRFASNSYTLEAGTYTISAYFKANGTEAGHFRLGYVKLQDGVVVDTGKDYIYDDTPAQAATGEWKEETFTFTLDATTELAVNIMNNKNGKGQSFLVDDVTLTAGESEGEGEEPEEPATISTIAEVLAAGPGEAAVKGTIIATYSRGFLVSDATGTILVYLGSDKGNKEGDVVTVSGTTSTYGGLLQFAAGSAVETVGTAAVNHPTPETLTGAQLDEYLAAPAIKYVQYTGTLTINGNYYNVAVEGAQTAIGSIQYPKEGIVEAASGSVVKVTGYTIGTSSGKYVNTMAIKVEVIKESEEPEEPATISTIAEVLAAGPGEAAVKGTIIATYSRGFLVSDATGTILVYLGSDKGNKEGDVVTVSGTTSTYGGLLQFAAGSAVETVGTATVNHPTPETLTGAQLDEYLAAPAIKYVQYTGTLTINGNYYNVAVEGAQTAIGSIQYPKEGIVGAASGSVVKVTGYTIGTSSGKYVNTMAVKVEVVEDTEEPEQPTEPIIGNVADALAAYVAGNKIEATVTGYIVGAVNGAIETGCEFGATEVATNILLADNADESDYTKCLVVQLPKGDIRNALNLADNADNYKKQIKISGSLETYFKVAGLKSITEYEFTGVTTIESIEHSTVAQKAIYDLTGRRIESITKPGIYIVNGKKMLVK